MSDGVTVKLSLRAALPHEGDRLKEIAIEAKAFWGYDRESVERWADQGDFSAQRLAELTVFVVDAGGRTVGWCSLLAKDDTWWLEDLWVEPEWIGKGAGSRLFRRAVAHARSLGGSRLEWEAEPNAVGFYERMGGRYLRDSEPSAFGRIIPVMGLDLGE